MKRYLRSLCILSAGLALSYCCLAIGVWLVINGTRPGHEVMGQLPMDHPFATLNKLFLIMLLGIDVPSAAAVGGLAGFFEPRFPVVLAMIASAPLWTLITDFQPDQALWGLPALFAAAGTAYWAAHLRRKKAALSAERSYF